MSADLARHGDLTTQLADTIRELGGVRALHITQQSEAWGQSQNLNVTERREYTRHVTAGFAKDIATLEAEVDALRVELAHVALVLGS